jgi:hypothetical protein
VIYPTEVNEDFILKNARNSILEIYSLSGKMIGCEKIYSDNQKVSLGTVPQGIYVVKISTDETSRYMKIIKL